jgi:gliding motility-associated lipoprotein GldH
MALKNNEMNQLFFILFCVCLIACNKNVVFNDYTRISETAGWARNVPIKFDIDIKDTNQLYDVYVNVRQATGYPYSNLFLKLLTNYPNKNTYTDTLECLLANERGEWLGDGAGDLWDNKILFKKNTKFHQLGIHSFVFTHAMRLDPLPLILDVGMSVEKTQSN